MRQRRPKAIQIYANAKLNLTLDVMGKRSDGYHDLRMVMQSVNLRDVLELELREEEGVILQSNLPYLPTGGKNLAVAAAQRFFAHTGQTIGLALRLHKCIPVCAGLGGGSSDAAAVLCGLNELLGMDLSRRELAEIGAQVGSDVPYCVLGGTALGEGRGEILTSLPALPECYVVLCKPAFSISTPELFSRVDRFRIVRRPDTEGMLNALEHGNVEEVARRMYNVFEDVLLNRQARMIAEIKSALIAEGALGACMSGTGPTVFGLFRDEHIAQQAWQRLRDTYEDSFLCKTVP